MYTHEARIPIFTYHRWFEVEENGSGHVLAAAGLAEEGLEALVARAGRRRQHAVGLYAVLQAVQLPTGVTHLHAPLTDVHRNHFALSVTIKF